MQLERLTITDVGTFGGQQMFDLAPRQRYGIKRPIVLVGGLNGAGKTTILTSVRLALYGRQSLESCTQKEYETFLRELIHRPNHSLVRTAAASISLEFTYAKLGEKVVYRVLRSWDAKSKTVEEQLRVYRNHDEAPWLVSEQAQAFLNQLIPSGISQFFFFDGEKIAALAQDDSDVVLADAIRRLFGLDLADRLSTDLSVYLRQRQTKLSDAKTQQAVAALEGQLAELEQQIKDREKEVFGPQANAIAEAREHLKMRRNQLMDQGGAWAVDRKVIEERLEQLHGQRRLLEDKMRDHLAGVGALMVAAKLSHRVIGALRANEAAAEQRAIAKVIVAHTKALKARLQMVDRLRDAQQIFGACIDEWAGDIAQASPDNGDRKYELSAGASRAIIAALDFAAPSAQRELRNLYAETREKALEEDQLREKLAHAPSEDSIKDAFDALTASAQRVATLEAERKRDIEELRRKLWTCIEITRKLKRFADNLNNETATSRAERLAESLQGLIADFKPAAAAEKCMTLRSHFLHAFRRLTRKDDIVADVLIDPTDFTVKLLDRVGREIPKKRLSAGEKQIYAIAMLEALAKTSGRNLPIIIDTPLGRLDSKHRMKLVESYFPAASHQVIVLSTDTEVDYAFYQGLQPHLSHGYHLIFDEDQGATKAEEGYFWKDLPAEGSSRAA